MVSSNQVLRTSAYIGEVISVGGKKCLRININIATCLDALRIAKQASKTSSKRRFGLRISIGVIFARTVLRCF